MPPKESETEKATESVEQDQWQSWYSNFDDNYGPDERRQWYSRAAKAYRWARPTYPDALVDDVIRKANLQPGDSILEIGCGPGIATASCAERGFRMQCVEPSPTACELAREACKGYGDVVVENNTFEDFSLEGQQFDAVLAATSFHWISPAIACKKSAAALKPGGSLILLWATPPQPSAELCEYLQPIYKKHREKHPLANNIRYQWRDRDYYQTNFEEFARTISNSGEFSHSAVNIFEHHSDYSIEKYIALLTTLSDYIALPEESRQALLDDLTAKLIEKCGDEPLSLVHWFGAQVAPLVADA